MKEDTCPCCSSDSTFENAPDDAPVLPDCCSHKSKERSQKEYKDLVNRLSRIEGQIRGIRKMLDNNAYCVDILLQASAANAALNSFNKVLLKNHMKTCVEKDIREGKEESMDELIQVIQRLMK
jgi:CsoR family transcriptional regulator, copper-sensing transcriptional repressor